MVDELQSLLERIQKDGVEQAEAEASRILQEAKDEARQIVAEAQREAEETIAKAQKDSEVFVERGTKALEQAARDVIISVQKKLERFLAESIKGTVTEALTPEVMAEMMVKLAESYGEHELNESRIDVLLSPRDQEQFVKLLMGKYRKSLGQGIEIRGDASVRRGFRISFKDENLYHDFTADAIAEALAGLLKSPLREIVKRAAQ